MRVASLDGGLIAAPVDAGKVQQGGVYCAEGVEVSTGEREFANV